jgi:hypothetical protein
MSYIVGPIQPDDDGFGFNVASENNPRPIISRSNIEGSRLLK